MNQNQSTRHDDDDDAEAKSNLTLPHLRICKPTPIIFTPHVCSYPLYYWSLIIHELEYYTGDEGDEGDEDDNSNMLFAEAKSLTNITPSTRQVKRLAADLSLLSAHSTFLAIEVFAWIRPNAEDVPRERMHGPGVDSGINPCALDAASKLVSSFYCVENGAPTSSSQPTERMPNDEWK